MFADTHYDKVAGLTRTGDKRRFHFEFENFFGELLFAYNLIHGISFKDTRQRYKKSDRCHRKGRGNDYFITYRHQTTK